MGRGGPWIETKEGGRSDQNCAGGFLRGEVPVGAAAEAGRFGGSGWGGAAAINLPSLFDSLCPYCTLCCLVMFAPPHPIIAHHRRGYKLTS